MILTKEVITGIDLEQLTLDKIQEGKLNEILLIVPTNRKARNYKKQIVSSSPNGVSATINLETLTTLTQKLLEVSSYFHMMSDAASSILIKQSIQDVPLDYFSVYQGKIPFGTMDRVKNLISKIKENGISVDDILSEAKENLTGSNKKKAIDLAKIYEKYKSKCRGMKYFEIGDVYEELLILGEEQIHKNFIQLYPDVKKIIFSGFDEFTIPEVKIVNLLAGISSSRLFIDFDYYEYNSYIFNHLEKCNEAFKVFGFNKVDDLSFFPLSEFKQTLRNGLFKRLKTKKESKYKEQIIKIKADNRLKEIEYIAKEIKILIEEKKTPPNKICISFNLIKNYSSIVRDVFAKYKIPINMTDRYSLDNSPLIIFIINLLNIEENDFYFKDVFKVLNNKYLLNYLGDTVNIIKVAGELKITIGKKNWIESIEKKISDLNFREMEEKSDYNDKSLYEDALIKINKLIGLLKPFSHQNTIIDFQIELKNLIKKLDIPKQIVSHNIVVDQKNIKALTTFLDTTDEILDLLKKEYGDDSTAKLTFFLENIKTACKWSRYNVKEISDYGVLITSINEIRGLKYDYLFISGLVDGDFPTRYNPEIFNQEKFLQKDITHQTEERYHFYQTLNCWDKGLYLTAPELNGESEFEESIFFKAIENLFEITDYNLEINAGKYKNMIFSDEEFLTFYGKMQQYKLLNEYVNYYTQKGVSPIHLSVENINHSANITNIRKENYLEVNKYNGYVLEENETEDNEEQKVREYLNNAIQKQFSITQLEEYAKCPFKYFVNRILKVRDTKDPSEEIEGFEFGNLLHEIMFDFNVRLRKENLRLNHCSDSEFEKIQKIMFEIAEKVVNDSNLIFPISFFEKEKILGVKGDKQNSILWKYLKNEQADSKSFLPKYFEVKFGSIKDDKHDEILFSYEPIEIGEIKIRGKIDRIDIDEENKAFNIIDYKSGNSKPTKEEINQGLSLQLPVYMMAAKKLLSEQYDEDYFPFLMCIYKLKYNIKDFEKGFIKIVNKEESFNQETVDNNENLFNKTEENIKNIIENIKKGAFNLTAVEKSASKICKNCNYQSICRINEVK